MFKTGWLCLLAVPALAAASDYRFVTEDFPPYSYAQGGQAAGPMADVLRAVCRRLARSCVIEVQPWRRALQQAEAGKVDGIFTVVDMPERRQYFHVSPPVIRARYVFVELATSSKPWHALQDVGGRTVGVYGPSATESALRELGNGYSFQVSEETDNLMALRKLAAGRYGANGLVLMNEGVASWLISHQHITGLRVLQPVRDLMYAFGLSRMRLDGDEAGRFASALHQLCHSGDMARLVRPYGLQPAPCS